MEKSVEDAGEVWILGEPNYLDAAPLADTVLAAIRRA